MMVPDDGKGFELPPSTSDLAASGKLGILGMQERVRLLAGNLDVNSEPGVGTSVVVTVPIQALSQGGRGCAAPYSALVTSNSLQS